MGFRMLTPERQKHVEELVEQYRPEFDPLPRDRAETLGQSPDVIRVKLCALHMPALTQHETWVMEQLGHVSHLEGKKLRALLARKHREWIDQTYPWLF